MIDIKNVNNIYKTNNVIYAEFHSYKEGKNIFGVETDYDIVFLQKSPNIGESIIRTNTDGEININFSEIMETNII